MPKSKPKKDLTLNQVADKLSHEISTVAMAVASLHNDVSEIKGELRDLRRSQDDFREEVGQKLQGINNRIDDVATRYATREELARVKKHVGMQ
jgi:hypothetical protein